MSVLTRHYELPSCISYFTYGVVKVLYSSRNTHHTGHYYFPTNIKAIIPSPSLPLSLSPSFPPSLHPSLPPTLQINVLEDNGIGAKSSLCSQILHCGSKTMRNSFDSMWPISTPRFVALLSLGSTCVLFMVGTPVGL